MIPVIVSDHLGRRCPGLTFCADSQSLCVVYCAVNQVNGKLYVGMTEKGLRARKMKHLANAKRGQSGKFYTAIRKHGEDKFHFLALKNYPDFWSALDGEREFISLLKPEYNLTDGGGGVKGLVFSDASRARMSEAKKGKPCLWVSLPNADEIKAKLSASARSRKGTYNLSPELKELYRGHARLANAARRRRVRCENTGVVYDSVKAAADANGTNSTNIGLWCRGVKCRSGFRFSYVEEHP